MKSWLMPLSAAIWGVLYAPLAAASCWVPVPALSHIEFNTTQAGAPFQGTFHDYTGLVCIDGGADNQIRVSLRTASVDTQLPELDEALRGPDFFDVSRWPQALFESQTITALGNGRYQATGKLTLRNMTHRVSVPFTFKPTADGRAQLEGQLVIKRLDYDIGLGQWADTRWVGNQVEVRFSVVVRPAASK